MTQQTLLCCDGDDSSNLLSYAVGCFHLQRYVSFAFSFVTNNISEIILFKKKQKAASYFDG